MKIEEFFDISYAFPKNKIFPVKNCFYKSDSPFQKPENGGFYLFFAILFFHTLPAKLN
jgi:hypothetical protein